MEIFWPRLTWRAQLSLRSAQLAASWNFVAIPLRGKNPVLPGWERNSYSEALTRFYTYLLKQSPAVQDQANTGILTGAPSGVVVMDIDAKTGGLARWFALVQQYGLPETLTVRSGSGGLHVYFRYTAAIADIPKIPASNGVEYQSNGGQVVFPYSVHPKTGEYYLFLSGLTASSQPILAEMPNWLQNYLRSSQR